jgi:hypothetical protein
LPQAIHQYARGNAAIEQGGKTEATKKPHSPQDLPEIVAGAAQRQADRSA